MNTVELSQLLSLAAAVGFASGIRLYTVVLVLGLAGRFGWLALPAELQFLANPVMLGAAATMVFAEFLADKIPAVDSLWDAIHTFIRIPAGAALAAAVVGGDSAGWSSAAAVMGGSLAAVGHFTKAGTRAAVNSSPEPFSNIAVSSAEDLAVAGLLWVAIMHPLVAAAIVLLLVLLALWLLPKVFRLVAGVFRRVFGAKAA
ncbi:MAG: DUF4126 domain-containing protein [Gammaproteobacteria bacterium]